jgi:hypothetical protein
MRALLQGEVVVTLKNDKGVTSELGRLKDGGEAERRRWFLARRVRCCGWCSGRGLQLELAVIVRQYLAE